MKRLKFLLILVLILILSGCAQPAATLVPTIVLATQAPTAVATLIPAATVAATKPAAPAGTAYPAGSVTATPAYTPTAPLAYPAPEATHPPKNVLPSGGKATATSGAAAAAASTSPFHDCARTPGLVGCEASALPVAARLAFFDPTAGRVIALDLQSGSGWQVALRPKWLQWSPAGDRLLLSQGAEGGMRYALFGADGLPQDLPVDAEAMQEGLRWQPDNTLSGVSTLRAVDGTTARLENTSDMRWLLHVQPKGGEEKTFDITPEPSDQLTLLVDWIPGTQRLLAQRYQASNAAMLLGGELVSIDTTDGTVQPLQIMAPLYTAAGAGADLAWNPVQKSLLAVITSGGQTQGTRRLALLDFQSNQLRYPLPDGVAAYDLSWRPDGSGLAFRAVPGQGVNGFPSAGIYQLDLPGGEVKALVQSPDGAVDGWPQWSPDGKALLYARGFSTQGGTTGAQVRLRQLPDGKESVLVEGLPGPREIMGQALWFEQLAYHPK